MLPKYIDLSYKANYMFSHSIFTSCLNVKMNVMRYMYYPHFINEN